MIGESTTTAGGKYKAAIFHLAQSTFATATDDTFDVPPYVCIGTPSSLDAFQIVSIGAVTVTQEPATLGTTRGREETLSCEVKIAVFMGGMDDVSETVEQRAFELMGMLEGAVHYEANQVDGTTLGGLVRWCFLTEIQQDTIPAEQGTTSGRESVIVGTFEAKVRVKQ